MNQIAINSIDHRYDREAATSIAKRRGLTGNIYVYINGDVFYAFMITIHANANKGA